MRIAERVARLEQQQSPLRGGRMILLMPWDPMPEHAERDLIGRYRLINMDGTEQIYEPTGVHPSKAEPGSVNHRLYFGGDANG